MKQCWCIPPEASAAFVWRMEEVLEVSTRPYDPRFPQVCMDESAKQLLQDKRESLPMQLGVIQGRGGIFQVMKLTALMRDLGENKGHRAANRLFAILDDAFDQHFPWFQLPRDADVDGS